jgi:hypothetical protein
MLEGFQAVSLGDRSPGGVTREEQQVSLPEATGQPLVVVRVQALFVGMRQDLLSGIMAACTC